MGIPKHFSYEVSQRALELICKFYDGALDSERKDIPEATFLLSVSIPIVILPIERIQKYIKKTDESHMNDVDLDRDLANAIKGAFNASEKFCDQEFFKEDEWQYDSLKKGKGFPNLAINGLTDEIEKQLTRLEAGQLSTCRFFRILRNALAHGRVLYLNKDGRSSYGDDVHSFVFVSTDKVNKPTELRILRINMADYRRFLGDWVAWMSKNSIDRAMKEDLGLDVPND